MSKDPDDYGSWPAEVRELYNAVLRSEAANDAQAGVVAFEHLLGLARQKEDIDTHCAARSAYLALGMRYSPETMARAAFADRGKMAVELAAQILSDPASDEATRQKAEEVLSVVAKKFPPKGRA